MVSWILDEVGHFNLKINIEPHLNFMKTNFLNIFVIISKIGTALLLSQF